MFRSNSKVNPGRKEKKQSRQKLENARIERENLAVKAKAIDLISHGKNCLSETYKPGKLYSVCSNLGFSRNIWGRVGKTIVQIPEDSIVFFVGVKTTLRGFSLQVIFNESVVEINYGIKALKEALEVFKPVDKHAG